MKLLTEISATMEEASEIARKEVELGETCQKLGAIMESKPGALAAQNVDVFTALENSEEEEKKRAGQLREQTSEYRKKQLDDKVEALLVAFNREADAYNVSFEKKYSDYCKARATLAKMFGDLLEGQREILETRERLTELVQITRRSDDSKSMLQEEIKKYEQREGLPTMHKLSFLPVPDRLSRLDNNVAYPEAVFFITSGDMRKVELFGVNSVALRREACSKEYMKSGPNISDYTLKQAFFN